MRVHQIVTEGVKVDNVNGIGSVPKNQDVDYFGLRVKMKPSIFLKLAEMLIQKRESLGPIIDHIQSGGAIGAPFLNIAIPDEWFNDDFEEPAAVVGHEGRHRMIACQKVFGDEPVEVHLFFRYLRRRDLTEEFIQELNRGMMNQDEISVVSGPLFTLFDK